MLFRDIIAFYLLFYSVYLLQTSRNINLYNIDMYDFLRTIIAYFQIDPDPDPGPDPDPDPRPTPAPLNYIVPPSN